MLESRLPVANIIFGVEYRHTCGFCIQLYLLVLLYYNLGYRFLPGTNEKERNIKERNSTHARTATK